MVTFSQPRLTAIDTHSFDRHAMMSGTATLRLFHHGSSGTYLPVERGIVHVHC